MYRWIPGPIWWVKTGILVIFIRCPPGFLPFSQVSHSQWGSNRTNNIDGAEAGYGCPTMQYSNQDASHQQQLCYVNKPPISSEPALHPNWPWRHLLGNRLLFVAHSHGVCIPPLGRQDEDNPDPKWIWKHKVMKI